MHFLYLRLFDGHYGCRLDNSGIFCDNDMKKEELNLALEGCSEYYQNQSNRLNIKLEKYVRPEETRLQFFSNAALVAGQ